ncbi:hypothetical protein [Paenibacillus sonchi]|uniref:hypothetical protein n=1 Tax=Paenibacillus sonchi TaxID=373687 RepID=UPI002FCDF038
MSEIKAGTLTQVLSKILGTKIICADAGNMIFINPVSALCCLNHSDGLNVITPK